MVDARLREHSSVAIDTSPFIYFFESSTDVAPLVRVLFDHVQSNLVSAITSVITITELLTFPLDHERDDRAALTEQRIRAIGNLRIVDVDQAIARHAAQLRSLYGLRTPDAIHVATAMEMSATAFVTNDIRLKRVQGIDVVLLGELKEP